MRDHKPVSIADQIFDQLEHDIFIDKDGAVFIGHFIFHTDTSLFAGRQHEHSCPCLYVVYKISAFLASINVNGRGRGGKEGKGKAAERRQKVDRQTVSA